MIMCTKKIFKIFFLIKCCFKRTILLGKQLLGLADKIEPGMTKWRGQLLFEMQSATVVLAQRALEEGKLKRFQAQVTHHPYFTSVLSSKISKIR